MDPKLTLPQAAGSADPGGELRLDVVVNNPNPEVEQYRLEVLGEAASWAQIEPAQVSVLPGESERTELRFRPPEPHGVRPGQRPPVGTIPFGVRCVSLERRDRQAV